MSILSVELAWDPPRRGRDGIERRREYTRIYEVVTDDRYAEEEDVAGEEARGLGLPGNGYAHPRDPQAIVIEIDAAQDSQTPYRWFVTVTYSTQLPFDLARESLTLDPATGESMPTDTAPGPDGAPPSGQRSSDPTDWSIVYSVTHEQTTVVAKHNNVGDPIVNSAGDPFLNPPVLVEKSYPVLTFIKHYPHSAFDGIAWLESYVDTVNAVPFRGISPRICRMIALDWESTTVANVAVWRVTFRVKIKRGTWNGGRANDVGQGWDVRILDQGFREQVIPGEALLKKIDPPRGDYGGEMPGPFPLNGEGVADFTATAPAYVTYRYYEEADWSGLGL